MSSWIYNKKFLTDMWFLFGTLSFTTGEDDDLEYLTQEQKERRTTMIGFEFHRDLENSATMFQVVVRQSTTTNPIDGPTRPLIETPSTTTRSSSLSLSEI
jgi:hypothetical protein